MAETPGRNKSIDELTAEIVSSRERVGRELRGLRHQLDFPAKFRRSFREQTVSWITAAAAVGALIALAPMRRKKIYVDAKSSRKSQKKLVETGFALAALKVAAALAEPVVPDVYKNELNTRGDSDFAYENEFARYRTSVVRQRLGIEIVFRVINSRIRTMDELGLPERLKLLTRYQNGLILATGSVGTGKSTTLAAMVEQVNLERRDHIITLEDPIEYILTSKNCHVTQREIFTHSDSFATALRASLREDPDVIMVGEMRDLETIALAITASETGHLVLATLHTSNASRTLDRFIDVFPPEQQEHVRVMVAESLRGVISHQLIPRKDGTGRVLALEVLTNTPAAANVIRENKTYMLPGIIQTGKKQGMRLMDDTLIDLYQRGLITAEEAYARAEQKDVVRQHVKT